MNSYLIKSNKSFPLRYIVIDKYCIDILHVRQTNQFIYRSIVTNITFQIRIRLSLLSGSHSKHGNIQHVCLLCINDVCLRRGNFLRDEMTLYSIRMYAIVYLR